MTEESVAVRAQVATRDPTEMDLDEPKPAMKKEWVYC